MICLAHGAKSVRTANGARDISIRAGLAVRDPQQRFPAVLLKLCSDQIKLAGEFTQRHRESMLRSAVRKAGDALAIQSRPHLCPALAACPGKTARNAGLSPWPQAAEARHRRTIHAGKINGRFFRHGRILAAPALEIKIPAGALTLQHGNDSITSISTLLPKQAVVFYLTSNVIKQCSAGCVQ